MESKVKYWECPGCKRREGDFAMNYLRMHDLVCPGRPGRMCHKSLNDYKPAEKKAAGAAKEAV